MRECEVAKGKVRRCEDKGVEVRRYDGKEWRSEGAQLQRQRSDTSISLICFATVHFRRRTFTFFSLHNLMQVPYFSEICRRCYGVIVLNAVWRPSCLLWIKVQYYFTGLCHTGYLFTVLDKLYYYVLHIKCNARSNGRVSFQTSVTVQSESAQMVQCYGLNNKRKKNFIIGQSL